MNEKYLISVLTSEFGFQAKSLDAMTVFYETPEFVLTGNWGEWELRVNQEQHAPLLMCGTLEDIVSWIKGGMVFRDF